METRGHLAGQVDIEDGKEDPLDPYIEAWNNGKGVSRTKADVATRMEQDHLRDTYVYWAIGPGTL